MAAYLSSNKIVNAVKDEIFLSSFAMAGFKH